jgi:hypothetical protein
VRTSQAHRSPAAQMLRQLGSIARRSAGVAAFAPVAVAPLAVRGFAKGAFSAHLPRANRLLHAAACCVQPRSVYSVICGAARRPLTCMPGGCVQLSTT